MSIGSYRINITFKMVYWYITIVLDNNIGKGERNWIDLTATFFYKLGCTIAIF